MINHADVIIIIIIIIIQARAEAPRRSSPSRSGRGGWPGAQRVCTL